MVRNLLSLLLAIAFPLGIGNAQTTQERNGLWASIDYAFGTQLLSQQKALLKGQLASGNQTGDLSLTIGHHIEKKWSAGVGLNLKATNNPYNLGFFGTHLEGKYRPFSTEFWDKTEFTLRLGTPLITAVSDYKYGVPFYLDLSTGMRWQIGKRFGVLTSLGLSYLPFSYKFDSHIMIPDLIDPNTGIVGGILQPFTGPTQHSSRFGVFLRIGLLFN